MNLPAKIILVICALQFTFIGYRALTTKHRTPIDCYSDPADMALDELNAKDEDAAILLQLNMDSLSPQLY